LWQKYEVQEFSNLSASPVLRNKARFLEAPDGLRAAQQKVAEHGELSGFYSEI
jgi:hypothetical protein